METFSFIILILNIVIDGIGFLFALWNHNGVLAVAWFCAVVGWLSALMNGLRLRKVL
jgi:hypothetical protein